MSAQEASDGDPPAVECPEVESFENLVTCELHLSQDRDRHGFAEPEAGQPVTAPVNSCEIPSGGNVRGHFVELSAHGEGRALVTAERQAVGGRLDGFRNDVRLLEECP